jgi:glycosyltransferase involved in cell wall biosynthesis
MPRCALNFICKDEGHIVRRMLNSALPITDLIVVCDTGSTDGTQDLIRQFGAQHKIPTYIFERPFDNFGNSREYARLKLIEVAVQSGWNLQESWGFVFDCDEYIVIDSSFNKGELDKDLYTVHCYHDEAIFKRIFFFRLKADCKWMGPVHERLEGKDPSISLNTKSDIKIIVESKGHSWKGDLVNKYTRYAKLMETFLEQHCSNGHYLHTTGQCYITAGDYCKKPAYRKTLYKKALEYYRRAEQSQEIPSEELYHTQMAIADILNNLNEPWVNVQAEYLKAHQTDINRAEPYFRIINHFLNNREWNNAYPFSRLAIEQYQGKSPHLNRGLPVQVSLYGWKALCTHIMICHYSGNKGEGNYLLDRLLNQTREHPELFSRNDLAYINSFKPFFLTIRNLVSVLKKAFIQRGV